ncbi:ATP-binding protein [uncultured Treponema sp.]|uniref:ATP-binding protein n=1 Tax=uncultured Treponema sp. TaxID=162155 RepID=UPI00262EF915|nr:ATP-binding protein [uncultured Treponema sp.]
MKDDLELFRPVFIENLKKFKDESIIKILCGVRRCGKSTILSTYKKELLSMGINPRNVIERLYSSMEFDESYDASQMNADLLAAIENADKSQKVYLLLDEVQEVENWEKCVNSLFENRNVDIYVTGSNSKLLSSEISTFLTGRFVLIPVYTLSFLEFMEFKKTYFPESAERTKDEYFDMYLKSGGFPFIAKTNHSQEENYQIIDGIYSTVVTRDISRRHNISNLEMFNRVVRFVLENLGKNFSAKTIFDFFKSQHRSVSIETIYNYIAWLEEAFIIYRCNRYDIQGKEILKTQEKYYFSDIGFKYSQFGYSPKSVASVLENIVYLELRRRGFSVYIGKLYDKEIDFVAVRHEQKLYVQVCRTLPEDSGREIGNLKAIKDSFPKYVVTMDSSVCGIEDGIKIVHIKDFLSGEW